jgi:hypothetical protein
MSSPHELFARRKDHGRAEAALIALFGMHQFNRIPAQAEIATGRIQVNDEAIETIK